MFKTATGLQLSSSDLTGHLNCRHLTNLDRAAANGDLEKPVIWDPLLELLRERGALHEKDFISHLEGAGFSTVVIEGVGITDIAVDATLKAMQAGAEIIIQGAFRDNEWDGRTDVLRKVALPSSLGGWSYEVIDTKLARETKGGTILQLCLYTALLSKAQGVIPEHMYVVAPWSDFQPQQFRVADYSAYFRRIKTGLEDSLAGEETVTYPDPKEHCDICRWRQQCDSRRRKDDHLSLVAGISKVQINELKSRSISTMTELAKMGLPVAWKPTRGSVHSYERIREQARIQKEGESGGKPKYETLPVVPGFGLTCLPQPSKGDIFLDLEGDPFVGEGGLEYLFGYTVIDDKGELAYKGDWAFTRRDEKRIFENFIDFVIGRWNQYPDLHIYHYAPYEPAALKRLMGRYASREEEVDRMLRAGLFVDLYSIVRNGVRASVESYSIKKMEPFYGYNREIDLPAANKALARLQACLELNDLEGINADNKNEVEKYNRDDCASTFNLRQWLEQIRAQLVNDGNNIPRPASKDGAPSENLGEWQLKINALIERLTADVPDIREERNLEQQARWVLAHILDWHRREEKAKWWEFFRLSALSAEELLEERAALSQLSLIGSQGGSPKAPVHRYEFPAQETELRGGESLHAPGGAKLGKVEAVSIDDRTVDIKKRGDSAAIHPEAVFAHDMVNTKVLADALVRIGEYVAQHGMGGDGPCQAARDLLLRVAPRIGNKLVRSPGETTLDAAVRVAVDLNGGIFPIQGPPGAGKTFTGAHMICALVKQGKKVGITANSHKVIRNLLEGVLKAAEKTGVGVNCIHKVSEKEEKQDRLTLVETNEELFAALGGSSNVAGGTAWLWAREDARETVDVLFVDEAAQMSLANVLAISHAAKSVVLLGDPQQLDQPMQGTHPEGTDASALQYILDGHQTIPPDKGLFLEETWRLSPEICTFTSELFYESRLRSKEGLDVQEIRSPGLIKGKGLRYCPVVHEGNQSSSPEEAARVRDIVMDILNSKATWIDGDGVEQPVTMDDILIMAPYNAQVFEIQELLPGARVGTVDKFQGQEAPISIYSLTTSSHADAPRGMEFLYSLNRLNVATSRAKCVCVLVGSPSVFEAKCRTPRQIQLANAFCRYLEIAERT